MRYVMIRTGILFLLLVLLFFFGVCRQSEAKSDYRYRTFEIIDIGEKSLTLQDNDGNVIEVDKDPGDHRVGYKVRYDSIRKRLRPYRWQDYEVSAISVDSITLQHETGDTLTVKGNYLSKFKVGDLVRYDSVGDKLQAAKDTGRWLQYTVVAAGKDSLTLEDNSGNQVLLYMDNNLYKNLYPEQSSLYLYRYKVGDLVRYNAATNKIKKGVLRTYDWQEYVVREVTPERLTLVDENNKKLELENTYGIRLQPGDPVRYDRLNNLLKKSR